MIWNWNLTEISWNMWTGFIWLRIGTSGGLFEHTNELSDSI
jgi:hypothetical protein